MVFSVSILTGDYQVLFTNCVPQGVLSLLRWKGILEAQEPYNSEGRRYPNGSSSRDLGAQEPHSSERKHPQQRHCSSQGKVSPAEPQKLSKWQQAFPSLGFQVPGNLSILTKTLTVGPRHPRERYVEDFLIASTTEEECRQKAF